MPSHHLLCQHLSFSTFTHTLPASPIKPSSPHLLSFYIHLPICVWILFHLILTSQTLAPHYPSPPPPPIYPILSLLAWLIGETGPTLHHAACGVSLPTTAMPTFHTQPLRSLITPHCKEIISGCDQLLKHDGPMLVFKWSWSCWFLIRVAEDA